jgi:hypothetical protein
MADPWQSKIIPKLLDILSQLIMQLKIHRLIKIYKIGWRNAEIIGSCVWIVEHCFFKLASLLKKINWLKLVFRGHEKTEVVVYQAHHRQNKIKLNFF